MIQIKDRCFSVRKRCICAQSMWPGEEGAVHFDDSGRLGCWYEPALPSVRSTSGARSMMQSNSIAGHNNRLARPLQHDTFDPALTSLRDVRMDS